MSKTEVVVYANQDLLAAAAAARLVTRLVDVQAAKGSASLVLTGGGTGIAVLSELRESSARDAIDWSRLDIYWGDERFVPADSTSGTRSRPARPCSTTSRWTRSGSTR